MAVVKKCTSVIMEVAGVLLSVTPSVDEESDESAGVSLLLMGRLGNLSRNKKFQEGRRNISSHMSAVTIPRPSSTV